MCKVAGTNTRGIHKKESLKLARDSIPVLCSPALGVNEQKKILSEIKELNLSTYTFTLEPDAWREVFIKAKSNKEIIEEITKEESEAKQERLRNNKHIVGATELRRQSMLKEYETVKFSKRMICICSDKFLRKSYIETFKYLSEVARIAYNKWKKFDYSNNIPLGMFSPNMPIRGSALSFL